MPTYFVDPWGLQTYQWHHLLPWQFIDEFDQLGIDINQQQFGWMLTPGDHSALHAAGWNDDWQDFFDKYDDLSDITASDLKNQYNDMLSDYDNILSRGKKASGKYPWASSRRAWDKLSAQARKGGKNLRKAGKYAGAAIAPLFLLSDVAGAATGCCSAEADALNVELRRFQNDQTFLNCNGALNAVKDYLECTGTDDSVAALQYYVALYNLCADLP